jgi:hypothetical protein
MAEQDPIGPGEPRPVRETLRELARALRQVDRLGPEERAELAALVEELAGAIDPAAAPELAAHLQESSAHMLHELHHREHDAGLLASARERLDAAASRARARAPVVTDVLRRLIDALGGIGA